MNGFYMLCDCDIGSLSCQAINAVISNKVWEKTKKAFLSLPEFERSEGFFRFDARKEELGGERNRTATSQFCRLLP